MPQPGNAIGPRSEVAEFQDLALLVWDAKRDPNGGHMLVRTRPNYATAVPIALTQAADKPARLAVRRVISAEPSWAYFE
jgi:hypothetical protein